jgi:hypothetical protein
MVVHLPTLANTGYNVGAPQVLTDVVPLRGEHKIYTTAAARIDDAWNPHPTPALPLLDFAGTLNAAGNTIYLPYNDDKITSVRLPNPPPAGVDFFLTANMSGCKFFVDTIGGSNDLIVYHANTHQHGSPPHNSPVNSQSAAAVLVLDAMHTRAQGDYGGLALANVATCDKHHYYSQAALAEQRKFNQGRRLNYPGMPAPVAPEFAGGCSVMGFFIGAAWEFYYQTWGGVDYSRQSGAAAVAKDLFTFHWKSIHNLRTKGTSHTAISDLSVVDFHRIF